MSSTIVHDETPSPQESDAAAKELVVEREPQKDGGLLCWLQVIGCFATWTNAFGLVNAYGEFQTYYESTLMEPPSKVAWIGSIQSFLLLFCGLFAGPLFDVGYFRYLLISGNVLIVLGMMLTSICKEYWQIVLTQGIVVGLGFGCVFVPPLAILPQYFARRLQFANGIAAVGSGFGGVIYPIVLRRLAPQIGFHWAVRILGFMTLFFAVVSVLVLRNRNEPKPMRRLIPPGLLKDVTFQIYTAGLFLILIALYIPTVYVSSYSLANHITTAELAFYLVPILQASNIGGRLLAFFADRTGPINLTIPALLIAAVLGFSWIAIHSEAGIIVFVILYGICFGTIQGLGPGCVASITTHLPHLGSRMGFSFGLASFGILIGTPVAGAILGDGENFLGVQVFSGAIVTMAMFFYIACRLKGAGIGMAKI